MFLKTQIFQFVFSVLLFNKSYIHLLLSYYLICFTFYMDFSFYVLPVIMLNTL